MLVMTFVMPSSPVVPHGEIAVLQLQILQRLTSCRDMLVDLQRYAYRAKQPSFAFASLQGRRLNTQAYVTDNNP